MCPKKHCSFSHTQTPINTELYSSIYNTNHATILQLLTFNTLYITVTLSKTETIYSTVYHPSIHLPWKNIKEEGNHYKLHATFEDLKSYLCEHCCNCYQTTEIQHKPQNALQVWKHKSDNSDSSCKNSCFSLTRVMCLNDIKGPPQLYTQMQTQVYLFKSACVLSTLA